MVRSRSAVCDSYSCSSRIRGSASSACCWSAPSWSEPCGNGGGCAETMAPCTHKIQVRIGRIGFMGRLTRLRLCGLPRCRLGGRGLPRHSLGEGWTEGPQEKRRELFTPSLDETL